MEFNFSQINVVQIIGIISLFLIIPLGIWNMKRMKTKKQQEEEAVNSMGEWNSSAISSEESSIDPNEIAIKDYILKYKSQYSREAIKSALKNNGYGEEVIEKYLNKYL